MEAIERGFSTPRSPADISSRVGLCPDRTTFATRNLDTVIRFYDGHRVISPGPRTPQEVLDALKEVR